MMAEPGAAEADEQPFMVSALPLIFCEGRPVALDNMSDVSNTPYRLVTGNCEGPCGRIPCGWGLLRSWCGQSHAMCSIGVTGNDNLAKCWCGVDKVGVA